MLKTKLRNTQSLLLGYLITFYSYLHLLSVYGVNNIEWCAIVQPLQLEARRCHTDCPASAMVEVLTLKTLANARNWDLIYCLAHCLDLKKSR